MSERERLRLLYMDGWYESDAEKLLAATAEDFIFDDPAEPELVTRDMLAAYMNRWNARVERLGNTGDWELQNHIIQDKDGIREEWHWWQLHGTGLQGSAFVRNSDAGVHFERITYSKPR